MPIAYEVIESIYEQCVEIADWNFECDRCGSKVVKEESFIEDDDGFYEIIFKYMA